VSKYKAEGPSEISLNAGQLVHVILKNPDGWWQGELQVTIYEEHLPHICRIKIYVIPKEMPIAVDL